MTVAPGKDAGPDSFLAPFQLSRYRPHGSLGMREINEYRQLTATGSSSIIVSALSEAEKQFSFTQHQ